MSYLNTRVADLDQPQRSQYRRAVPFKLAFSSGMQDKRREKQNDVDGEQGDVHGILSVGKL